MKISTFEIGLVAGVMMVVHALLGNVGFVVFWGLVSGLMAIFDVYHRWDFSEKPLKTQR